VATDADTPDAAKRAIGHVDRFRAGFGRGEALVGRHVDGIVAGGVDHEAVPAVGIARRHDLAPDLVETLDQVAAKVGDAGLDRGGTEVVEVVEGLAPAEQDRRHADPLLEPIGVRDEGVIPVLDVVVIREAERYLGGEVGPQVVPEVGLERLDQVLPDVEDPRALRTALPLMTSSAP
jgi:hypothetical protein